MASIIFPRAVDTDPPGVATAKIHTHALMMTIAFLILFPLGATIPHLPLAGRIRHAMTRLHAPIQLLALAVMIAAMGVGIDIAAIDDGYFDRGQAAQAHIVLGLIVTCSLILFQPALGLLQHLYFKKHAKGSWMGFVHRWFGRVMIIAGWVNSWLGFMLSGWEHGEGNKSAINRNAILMSVFGALWLGLVVLDGWRHWVSGKEKLAAYRLGWDRGFVLKKIENRSDRPQDLEVDRPEDSETDKHNDSDAEKPEDSEMES